MKNKGEIIIYEGQDNQAQVEVQFEGETCWLSLNQIAQLYGKDKSVISRHLKNIFKEGELDEAATVAKNATVQVEAGRSVKRDIEYFNLDAILSVGYRVNSKRGTQFRKWATDRLKEYLVQGYIINQKRLDELGRMVHFIERSGKNDTIELYEAKGLLDLLSHYTRSFILLNQFESRTLEKGDLTENISYEIKYPEAKSAIAQLKNNWLKRKRQLICLEMKKTMALKVRCKLSFRHLVDNTYIPASKNKQHILYTSLLKIILLPTVINELALFCSFGFWRRINIVLSVTVNQK